jgi:RNA polymerase sigma-70 factor (ECF subfamily)
MADGPAVGLRILDRLLQEDGHLRRHGRTTGAVAAYDTALALVGNQAERDYLLRRRNQLTRTE